MNKSGKQTQLEVLAALRRHGGAVSAYRLLSEMRGSYPKIAPPTVYRALSALADLGCVHRVESLNAFVACQCETHQQPCILTICDDCGSVEENVAPDLVVQLSNVVEARGFSPSRHVIEVHGRCAACDSSGAVA